MRFMIIQFVSKADGAIDEQVTLARKLKKSDIQSCNIVMDFFNRRLDKCIINGKKLESDWDTMVNYYRKIYPDLIDDLENENKQG